jgi:hypothetical protein
MKPMKSLCVCLLAVSVTACNKEIANQEDETSKEETARKNSTTAEQPTAPLRMLSMTEQVNGAKEDLANRVGVAQNDIIVHRAAAVTWGSSDLGCPQPGMEYTQAAVPGLLVILESGDDRYRYHGGKGRPLVYCPADRAKPPAYGLGEDVM